MRAILLAAGRGSRISQEIGCIPKSTLRLNGIPVIRRTVKLLRKKDIKVAVCTGYCPQKISEALNGIAVEYFFNPFYQVTNSMASLWFAREFITGDDVIILNADVVFESGLLNRILLAPGDLLLAADAGRVLDGDYFLHLSPEGKILEYGPNVETGKRSCEYMGISKISREWCSVFVERLVELVEKGLYQDYFEKVFFSFNGGSKPGLSTIDVTGCRWRELDFIEDYRKAIIEFSMPEL